MLRVGYYDLGIDLGFGTGGSWRKLRACLAFSSVRCMRIRCIDVSHV